MKLIREIKSKNGKLHFRRWKILSMFGYDLCIHGIYESDKDLHLHNHPWAFFNIVLWGVYVEELEWGKSLRFPFRYSYKNGSEYHRILDVLTRRVYTLNLISKKRKEWGYLVDGQHVDNKEYRKRKRNL